MVQIDLNKFYRDRQFEMREMRVKGFTLEMIGQKHKISRERVRQILETDYPVKLSKDLSFEPRLTKLLPTGVDWNNPSAKNIYTREKARSIRKQAVDSLGGICAKCGFSDHRALQIDHIHGGGVREIRENKAYSRYKKIIENPETAKLKYQILCANCNWIKRDENNELGRKPPTI